MKVATRAAFGDALAALGARPEVVVIDGEVGNSTFTEKFGDAYPDRFFQMYISEQQMIGAAVGMSVRGYVPFAATFAAFFTRAYDFIRMAAVSQADIRLCGSHAGVEIGQDGPSQMGLEDLAALRAVHGSTVLYPSDANSAAALTAAMADLSGVSYLRTTRGAYPVLYAGGRGVPGRRLQAPARVGRRPRAARRRRRHAAHLPRGRGAARRARHAGAGHRPVLGQAAGRRGPGRGGARRRTPHRRRRGPLSGGRPGRSRAGRPRPAARGVPRRAPRRARHARLGHAGRAHGGGRHLRRRTSRRPRCGCWWADRPAASPADRRAAAPGSTATDGGERHTANEAQTRRGADGSRASPAARAAARRAARCARRLWCCLAALALALLASACSASSSGSGRPGLAVALPQPHPLRRAHHHHARERRPPGQAAPGHHRDRPRRDADLGDRAERRRRRRRRARPDGHRMAQPLDAGHRQAVRRARHGHRRRRPHHHQDEPVPHAAPRTPPPASRSSRATTSPTASACR